MKSERLLVAYGKLVRLIGQREADLFAVCLADQNWSIEEKVSYMEDVVYSMTYMQTKSAGMIN